MMTSKDYSPSDLEPHKLEKEEIKNPYLVFYRLFDFANLPQIRNILWNWLKITVSGGYNKDICDYRERHRILYFYEFLEKAIEASHILYRERKEELRRENSNQFDILRKEDFVKGNFNGIKELYKLCRKIVELVNPVMIFLLGTVTKEKGKQYFLLILMPDFIKRQTGEYESMIQNKFNDEIMVVPMVHRIQSINRYRKNGNVFFINNCSEERLLYNDKTAELDEPLARTAEEISRKATNNLHEGLSKARAFLRGAEFYVKEQEYIIAAFMLHQATEHSYTAVLHSLTGYREQTHNILKLWTYGSLWTPQLNEALPLDTEQDQHLFKLMQKAYGDARYKDGFVVSRSDVEVLISKVQSLQKVAGEMGT